MAVLMLDPGWLDYRPGFIAADEAAALYEQLRAELAWRDEVETDGGLRVRLPRAVAWHGEPEAVYPYAGFTHRPEPWTPALRDLRQRAEAASGIAFNGVLGNFYQSGRDAMGWHADREPVLGDDPLIASFSFGAARPLRFRPEAGGEELELWLEPGSLLIMAGSLQHHWLHCLPEHPGLDAPRLNLNFRCLRPEPTRPAAAPE